MGSMDGPDYPALKKCATPALFLLVLGCSAGSPIDGKTVAQWEHQLINGDATAQAQAGLGLAKLGPESAPATPALMTALRSTTALVRQNAAVALGAIGPEARAAVPVLAAGLSDPEWAVRRQCAVALGAIGPDAKSAATALKKAATDKHSLVQKAAKEALKLVGAS